MPEQKRGAHKQRQALNTKADTGAPEKGREDTPAKKGRSRRRKNKGPASPNHVQQARGRWRHTYAAVDLGTSNCRLLVAKPSRSGFRVIDAFSRTVRLGEGVEKTGQLSDLAMDRAMEALKICASKIRRRGVTRMRAIATEACRLADNGADFMQRVEQETGLVLDIIPADEEARLAVAGCCTLLDRKCEGSLIFDIGGGSTELVWLDLRKTGDRPNIKRDSQAITAWTSLPYGVVNLAERYGGGDVPPEIYEEMVQEVYDHLKTFQDEHDVSASFAPENMHLLGTSGTVTTLAGIYLKLERYDRAKVDGAWIMTEAVHTISQRIAGMSYDQRTGEPCVGHDRADLVVAGCAIFDAIYRLWPCERLRVADRGLREGMLLALMDKADRDHARRRKRRSRRRRKAAKKNAEKAARSSTVETAS